MCIRTSSIAKSVRIYTEVSLLARRIFEVTLSDVHKHLVERTPEFSKGFIPLIARIAECRDVIVCDCSWSGLGRAKLEERYIDTICSMFMMHTVTKQEG